MAAVSNLVDFSVAEEYQMADDMAELESSLILESGAGPVTPSPEENLWFHAHVHNVCNTLHQIEVYRDYIELVMNESIIPRLVKLGYLPSGLEFKYAKRIEMSDEDCYLIFMSILVIVRFAPCNDIGEWSRTQSCGFLGCRRVSNG